MSLSAELARPLPPVPHPYRPKYKCALEVEADRTAEAFGGVPREIEEPKEFISEVERKLDGPEGVSGLDRRELKVVPYILWGANPRWRDDRAFTRAFLSVVGARWPGGLRRLWRHYALNFEPDSPVTLEMAGWFRSQEARMPELLQRFSAAYHLFDPDRSRDVLASRALQQDGLMADLATIGIGTALFRTSALCVTTIGAVGERLPSTSSEMQVVERLRGLLDSQPKDALAEAACGPAARARALRSLIDGLVAWHEGFDPAGNQSDAIVQFLLALNGDPRFVPERWNDRVSPKSKEAMQRWLSRKTIDAFFRVIDGLKTDRPDMWEDRRAFWMSYLPYVDGAWLVVGADAVPLAAKEATGSARFEKGDGTQRKHCGLLLQIRNMCVLEMNLNGRAVFWDSSNSRMPSLYQSTYNRFKCIHAINDKTVFGLTHHPGWQYNFRNRILQMTGVSPR